LPHPQSTTKSPSLGKLTEVFFRIGNTTFGGGYITMIMLGRDMVARRGWVKQDDYELAFSLARITPGTNIIAFCAAVGSLLRGWPGAILAVAAVTLPSALIAVLLQQGFETWRSHPYAMAAIAVTSAAVTGMMWSTVWMLARPYLGGHSRRERMMRTLRGVVLLGGSCLAAWLGVTPLPIIFVAMILGFLWLDDEPPASNGDKA
jgi:chromate transporter